MIPFQLSCVPAHSTQTSANALLSTNRPIAHAIRPCSAFCIACCRPHPTKPPGQTQCNSTQITQRAYVCPERARTATRDCHALCLHQHGQSFGQPSWCLRTGTGRAIARWAARTAEGLWGRGGYSDSVAVRLSCMQVRRQYGHSRTLEVGSLRAYHCLSEQ